MALAGNASSPSPAGFDDNDVHQLAAAKLQVAGQRYTRNRRLVVAALLHCGPSTIAEILHHDHDLAQSSTYRSLVVLEEAGVAHRIVTADDHARFELTEDITGHHHHHLVCHNCGGITDVSLPSDVERQLDRALSEAARRHRFTTDHHRVDLVGLCERCVSR